MVLVKEQTDQWKSTEINANKHNQLIFDKGAKKKFNEERITFSTKDAGTTGHTQVKKKKRFWMQIMKLS